MELTHGLRSFNTFSSKSPDIIVGLYQNGAIQPTLHTAIHLLGIHGVWLDGMMGIVGITVTVLVIRDSYDRHGGWSNSALCQKTLNTMMMLRMKSS